MYKNAVFGLMLGVGLMTGSAAMAQNAEEGEKFFKKACAACHTVEAGKNRVGPSLAKIVDRPAGSVQGFAYSPAMKNSGITWNEENLGKYLVDPKGFIAGNKMAYVGVKAEADLKNVIAYLKAH